MSSFFNFFKPVGTPSPPNMSPAGSPRGPVSYGPGGAPISPTVSPEELREISQAQGLVELLMKRSQVPEIYRAELAPYIAKHLLDGRKMPPDQQNTDAVLISLSSHTCVKTWIRKAFEDYEKKIKNYTKEEQQFGRKAEALNGTLDGIGMVLGQGFNYFQEPPGTTKFFKRDPSGKIIGIVDEKNQRFKECHHALTPPLPDDGKGRRKRVEWREDWKEEEGGLGEELLPAPAPSAGKRKKTKKNKSKKRKTLRRRKLHR